MKVSQKLLAALTGLAALALAMGALLLCGYAMKAQPRILSDAGAPEDTVAAFFDAVCTGDYDLAAGLVENCAGLGLGSEPEGREERLLYRTLLESFRWEAAGVCTVEGLEATAPVRFVSLDVPALTALLRDAVMARLACEVESARYAGDVYDENGDYRAAVVDRALIAAVEGLLEEAPERSAELDITLRYTSGSWRVVWDKSLADALCGGAVG